MANILDTLAATSAWVASLAIHGHGAVASQALPIPARDALRAVQMELYCGHDAVALAALRATHRALLVQVPPQPQLLAMLDEAAWRIRRHEAPDAQRTLERALDRLV